MEDDTRQPGGRPQEYGQTLLKDMAEISSMVVNRNHTYAWAQRLRFLVYDDPDNDTPSKGKMPLRSSHRVPAGFVPLSNDPDDEDKDLQAAINLSLSGDYEDSSRTGKGSTSSGQLEEDGAVDLDESSASEDEEEVLQRAIKLSLQEDGCSSSGECEDAVIDKVQKEPQQSPAQNPQHSERRVEPDESEESNSCDACSGFPEFPPEGQATTFRVVTLDPETHRSAHDCNHYLAVSYCWPKDDNNNPVATPTTFTVRTNKDDGTIETRPNRAPDNVIYEAVRYARKCQIKMIWIDQECLPQDDSEEQELGIQAMDMVYQRAALSMGLMSRFIMKQNRLRAISLVLQWHRLMNELSVPPFMLQGSFPSDLLETLESISRDPFHTRAWTLQEMHCADARGMLVMKAEGELIMPDVIGQSIVEKRYKDLIAMPLDVLTQFTTACLKLLPRLAPTRGTDLGWQNRVAMAVSFARGLHPPRPFKALGLAATVHVRGGANFGARRACNAAVAVTYLHRRNNYRPADRLAILANMCDYEIRLDTVKLEKRFQSLSLCLLTLSLINGDLSLLCPESYGWFESSAPAEGPSWIPRFYEALTWTESWRVTSGLAISFRNANRYRLTEHGFHLTGYIWEVDRQVDLTPIQWAHRDDWDTLRESESDRQLRVDTLRSSFAKRDWQFPSSWDLSRDENSRMVFARMIENESSRNLLAKIFLNIVLYLHSQGESEAADSLWYSVRAPSVPKRRFDPHDNDERVMLGPPSDTEDLPDRAEQLASIVEDFERPWKLLQLDQTFTGAYHQAWIIDRVMKDGFLWVGSYVETKFAASIEEADSDTKTKSPSLHESAGSSKETPGEQENEPHTDTKQSAEGAESAEPVTNSATERGPFFSQILKTQLRNSLFANMIRVQKGPSSVDINTGMLVAFAASRELWTAEAERQRGSRRAVFDVDGPCTVVTPFDSDLERLPRSEWRSMSLAWVVEKVEENPETFQGPNIGAHQGSYRVVSKVKGAWFKMEEPMQAFRVV